MKYIMIEVALSSNCRQLVPIIFPECLVHADMAKVVTQLFDKFAEPVSAGFVHLEIQRTYGKSESLDLTAEDKDADKINCINYVPVRYET